MLPAYSMDVDRYREIANTTIRQMNMGVVGDIDAAITSQEQLMIVGINGGIEYIKQNPRGSTPLQEVLLNAEKMKTMSLDEIEAQWHSGEFLKKKGIDPETIDHFGPMMSLMDSIIHPATSYLLLKEYKRTGDPDLLSRIRAELLEVLEHVSQLEPSHVDIQLSSTK